MKKVIALVLCLMMAVSLFAGCNQQPQASGESDLTVALVVAGTFGDLIFSAIKRQTGIKDYGNLIPGHGGVLDRFDSVIIVAPLVEILLALLPVVE